MLTFVYLCLKTTSEFTPVKIIVDTIYMALFLFHVSTEIVSWVTRPYSPFLLCPASLPLPAGMPRAMVFFWAARLFLSGHV